MLGSDPIGTAIGIAGMLLMVGFLVFFLARWQRTRRHEEAARRDVLKTLADRFEGLDVFDAASIEAALSGLADELEIKKAKLIHPTRLATTGVPAGPSLYELLELLSQPVVVERMKRAAGYINDSTELS